MEKFYGRELELKKLQRRYDGGRFECIVIYGRRRVGKTALINEFLKGKPAISLSALNTTGAENLAALSKAISTYECPTSTSAPVFPDYFSAFDRITELAKKGRVVLVIDEFPYLAKTYPAVSSMLQHLIDHAWAETGLFLILCGSSMSFMEHQVLGVESPLFGRRTAQFRIEPLDYREAALFHPELSHEDNALIYGITGGVPHYINKLDVHGSVDEALIENVFDSAAYLYEEPNNLLKQELRNPGLYSAILRAIASGGTRLNEIAGKTHESTGLISNHLKTLEELGIVRRETPMAETPGRKSFYLLQDSFFRFWFRFAPENASAINSDSFSKNYPTAVRRYLPDFMGNVFEQMCKQYLLKFAEELPFPLGSVGQWWGADPIQKKQIQIDIVGKGAEPRRFLIGSCKYRNASVGIDELELMRSYASAFGKGDRYDYCFFSKGGFTDGLREAARKTGAMLFTLEDLYRKD